MSTADSSIEPTAVPLTVLVHGAWHGAWCWSSLQSELDRRGLPSIAVDLPGHGASREPAGDLHADADAVAAVLDTIAERGSDDVVLIGHSYGGAVVSQAAAGRDDVAALVYVAAFALHAEESVMGALGSFPRHEVALGRAMVPNDDGSATTVTPDGATAAFYGRCDEAAVRAALPRLVPQPMTTMTQPTTASALGGIASTYVVCTEDDAVHPEHQREMAARCDRSVAIDTDHSPFLSAVGELADVVESVVRGAS